MEDLLLDIRYALRVLWKSPAFTLVALVTLMLGIGANVVVFGVLNAVLLHPLKVSDPQNLYQLRLGSWTNWKLLTTDRKSTRLNSSHRTISYAVFCLTKKQIT